MITNARALRSIYGSELFLRDNALFDRNADLNIMNKTRAYRRYLRETLNKTMMMFEYINLPDSIPKRALETMLQLHGNVVFFKYEDVLYAQVGGMSNVPDVYLNPTGYTWSNPALRGSGEVQLGVNGVLMRNDSHMLGLEEMLSPYIELLVELDVSFFTGIINTRMQNVFSAANDDTYESAKEYLQQIRDGGIGIIRSKAFFDGDIEMHTTSHNQRTLSELKETKQYIKSEMYEVIGLHSVSNMKSQYVSDTENIVDNDGTQSMVHDMLYERRIALEEINKIFGTQIEVELSGIWKEREEESELYIEKLEVEAQEDLEEEVDLEPEEELEAPEEAPEEPEDTPEPEPEPEPDILDGSVDVEEVDTSVDKGINEQDVTVPEDFPAHYNVNEKDRIKGGRFR